MFETSSTHILRWINKRCKGVSQESQQCSNSDPTMFNTCSNSVTTAVQTWSSNDPTVLHKRYTRDPT
eukprot:10142919-Heterocapsa_arctica.AAC.1